MARTAIYLDPEMETLLKLEAMRRKRPISEILREALQGYLEKAPRPAPPGCGAFASGHTDTASRAEQVLGELGFGEDAT